MQRNFLNKKVIQLPIQIEAPARATIQEIQLFVKERANAPWVLRDKGGPAQASFLFHAPADGEYWFTMATIDKQGRTYPADLRNEPPGLVVVIDTQKPVVELTNLGSTPEGQLIQCDVRDANLDNAKLRVSFQGGDKVFRAVESVPGRGNVYCIPVQAVSSGLIRATAVDLAGNYTAYEEHLNHMQVRSAPPSSPPQVGANPPSLPEPRIPTLIDPPTALPANLATGPEIMPIDPLPSPRHTGPAASVEKDTHERTSYRPNGSDGPRFVENAGGSPTSIIPQAPPPLPASSNLPSPAPASSNLPAQRQIVNSTKVFLDYQIENAGQANAAKVEVWMTRDQGQNWTKLAEDAQSKSPLEVTLPGEGLFGVMLVVGAGAPPTAKDAPDWWIEVDTTKPAAQITGIQTVHDKGQPSVLVRWTAQDKNLGDTPVDLFYAATPQGPWQPIAKGLKAQGEHRWTPPAGIGAQAHLQLVVHDTAGNTSVCNTLEPIVLQEQARPRAVIRNVSTNSTQIVLPTPGN